MILYIGNFLSKHGFTPTYAEELIVELNRYIKFKKASTYKNKILRIIHMWFTIMINSKCKYILIDTYSTSAFYFALTCSEIANILKIKYIPILHGGNLEKRFKNNPYFLKRYLKNAYKIISPSLYP